VHVGACGERTANEAKNETRSDAGEEHLEGQHVSLADALRTPRAVMVQLLATIITKTAVFSVDIFPRDCLAISAKFSVVDSLDFIKISLGVSVGVPGGQPLVHHDRRQE